LIVVASAQLYNDVDNNAVCGSRIGVVVIGRNEGQRLVRCLDSIPSAVTSIYVDSGSSDGSVARAREKGVSVVELPVPPNFTAARARNAGLEAVLAVEPTLEFVQMIDGDCEFQPGWIDTALLAIREEPEVAVVFGRLRERFPERSIFNALCDDEWNSPVGESALYGGIALFRVAALHQVGCYNAAMIAGEDTEMAMRMRKIGWRLRRIDVEMAWHDADITRFSQWWNRTRRSGHGYGEMAFLHPDARNPDWPHTVRSIIAWGGILPSVSILALVLSLTVSPAWWAVLLATLIPWPIRMFQLYRRQRRRDLPFRVARASGIFLMLGKIPQFIGLVAYHRNRISGEASRLIEYKGTKTI
jgi:glycosyltransferase involved in cell wall biosynthesis